METLIRGLKDSSAVTGFYLAGGTGLALQLGHRRSRDLDFFCDVDFDPEIVLERGRALGPLSIIARAERTLHIELNQIKVSFLGYSYRLLFDCQDYLGVPLADPLDIACMKISAITSRGSRRDFVDLFLAARPHGLDKVLALFASKYAETAYNHVHLLKSLTYFDDAEQEPMPDMLVPLEWNEVKRYFLDHVARRA